MNHPHHALICSLVEKKFGISPGRLTRDARFQKDLGLDSLDQQLLAAEIESALEDQLDLAVDLSDEVIAGIKTYGQLLEAIPKTSAH